MPQPPTLLDLAASSAGAGWSWLTCANVMFCRNRVPVRHADLVHRFGPHHTVLDIAPRFWCRECKGFGAKFYHGGFEGRLHGGALRYPGDVPGFDLWAKRPLERFPYSSKDWESRAVCNDYEQLVDWEKYRAALEALDLGIPTSQGPADLRQAADIRISDEGPVMRAAGNGIELAKMMFAIPQSGRGPLFNFKSEGRKFDKSNRCVIIASAFFEFTGKKSPKAKHRFTLNDAPFLGIAGIWREIKGTGLSAFAMLTTAPGPDVAPFHNRQIVVLRPEDWASWIYLSKPEDELLRPVPGGSLKVETVRPQSD